jgi:uncharacterized protein YacL (UPF0231 family)
MTITPKQLFEYARKPDVELRMDTHAQSIKPQSGSLGGRIARAFKIINHENREAKRKQYREAKEDVQRALIEMYGPEVGKKAFRAKIGHMRGDRHVSSSDHRITGRHIQKMIKKAESLIQRDVQQVRKTGLHSKHDVQVTGRGIAAWMQDWNPRSRGQMLEERINSVFTEPDLTYSIDETNVNLRAYPVSQHGLVRRGGREVEHEDRREAALGVGRDLLRDAKGYFQANPEKLDGFWTLRLMLPRSVHGSNEHSIGIRMVSGDQEGRDMVHVFDANSREIKIPNDEFGGWLATHLRENYGEVVSINLYRTGTEQTLGLPMFVRRDGKWDCDEELDFDPPVDTGRELDIEDRSYDTHFREYIGYNVEDPPVHGAYPSFWKDLTRSTGVEVGQPGETPLRLTPANAIREMTELVKKEGEDDPASDAMAVLALSSVFGQSAGHALSVTAAKARYALLGVFDDRSGSPERARFACRRRHGPDRILRMPPAARPRKQRSAPSAFAGD